MSLGVRLLPPVFVWFLFRRGYSNALRLSAILYLGLGLMLALIR